MKIGIEKLIGEQLDLIRGKRVGLLVHAASVDSNGDHTLDRLVKAGANITAIFGPEHGIATKAQDMEPVASAVDVATHIPVYSLYGDSFESLSPTREMLADIDIMVIDLQDIGSRYYTYIWTACLCMSAAAAAGKPVVICDRPNPLGGIAIEGALPHDGFASFVGLYPLPVRHGMTIGEIAHHINDTQNFGCDLTVIPMEGWKRAMLWPDTKLAWTNPSPNMRSFNSALLYPGMCLLEATNISEGRGTDTPFDIVGAPYIDPDEIIDALGVLNLPGVHAAPTSFIPTRQKHFGTICHGVRWVIDDPKTFQPYLTGLAFVWLAHKLYKDNGFAWRTEPYEFVADIPAIDLLTGSAAFREGIDGDFDALRKLAEAPGDYKDNIGKYLLY